MTHTFEGKVAKLIEENKGHPPGIERCERIHRIDEMLNGYVAETGERPNSDVLETLADEILAEELRDPDEHKMSRYEYPIMSERQFERRYEREASDQANEWYGSDGKSYLSGKRRKRTKYENNFMDKGVRTRNAERKRQYRKDTAPGPVITYTMPSEEIAAYLEETYGYRKM
jgi:hypothetical protein